MKKFFYTFYIFIIAIVLIAGYINKYLDNITLAIIVLFGGLALNFLTHELIFRYKTNAKEVTYEKKDLY